MNTHCSKIGIVLCVGVIIVAFMLLITVNRQIVTAAPQTITADAGADITDYPIGEQVTLDGSGSSGPAGATLYYSWQVVAWPLRDGSDSPDLFDSDHHDGEIGHFICPRSDNPQCIIGAFAFFDADDVGTWTVRLTVDDGVNSATDDLLITIKGYGFNERRPNAAERNVTEVSNGCIQPGTLDSNFILESQVMGVIYEDDENNGEDYSMQAPLIALLEHLLPYAQEDNLLVRVTDAWDSDCSGHGTNSTHYEGRGLDIKGREAGVGNEENPQEVRRLALRVQQAAQEAGFNLDLNTPANSNIWIFAEPKYSDPENRIPENRLPGQDHVHVSIKGQHRGPYNFGTICDSADCLTHVESLGIGYSAAAAAEMVLEWQGWTGIQQELYWFGVGMDGTNCETMAGLLNMHINRGWTCMRFSSLDEALRTAAFWMDITQEGNKEGLPFPVLIPMDSTPGDFYDHWVAIQGYIATADPSSEGSIDNPGAGSYQVGGLFVLDPYVDSLNTFARRFVGSYELAGNYHALHSEILPNLGITYSPSGPPYTASGVATTYELVVPAGCTRTRSNPMGMLAAFAGTQGTGLFCDSRYSIVNPPPDSTVSSIIGQNTRVITMVPSGIPHLKVAEINETGDEWEITTLIDPRYIQTTSDFFGSSVWEFAWTPFDSYAYRYRLTVIDPLNPEESCGSVEVIPSSGPDSTQPEVFFLQPFNPDGTLERIEVRNPHLIKVRALDNQGIQIINEKDNVQVKVQSNVLGIDERLINYEYCGPACYQFWWDLNDVSQWPDGSYVLTATATDGAGNIKDSDSARILVGPIPPVSIDYFSLHDVSTVTGLHEINIIASGGTNMLVANVEITGPRSENSDDRFIRPNVLSNIYDWNPPQNGSYTVKVTVYDENDSNNRDTESKTVTVNRSDVIQDGEWEIRSPSTSPGVKNAAMADTGNGVYLFGGERISGGVLSHKLWKWDGTNWIDKTPTSPSTWPEARTYPQFTYDSNRERLVLFGGLKADGTILRDVWEYLVPTGQWVERTIYPIPHFTKWPYPTYLNAWAPGKGSSRMAYDSMHDRTFLLNSYSFFWNSFAGNWEENDIYGGEFDTVGYDSGRNVLVTFLLNGLDIIEWDGSQWNEIPIPAGRLTPIPKQAKFVGSPFGVYLIGGETSTKDLWLWDGAMWVRINASQGTPPNTDYYSASVAYDSARCSWWYTPQMARHGYTAI